nr:hypothetical protein [uncultured Actinoplanes sp.]
MDRDGLTAMPETAPGITAAPSRRPRRLPASSPPARPCWSPAFRGRIMALWVFVYLGTTPIGSVLTGWIMSTGGPRAALWVGAGSCLVAAAVALRVHTPPHPDAVLTDIGTD